MPNELFKHQIFLDLSHSMNKIFELLKYYQKKGFWETLKRIKTRYFTITKFILYKRNLDEEYLGIELDPDYNVIIDDFDFLNEMRLKRNDLPREFYIDKTHGGRHFYVVLKGEEIAYIHWVLLKGDYSRFFNLKDGNTVELNYNITLPVFRGNRLMAKTINFICHDLKKKGYRTLVGAVSKGNILSHKSMHKAGFYEFNEVFSFFSLVKKTDC